MVRSTNPFDVEKKTTTNKQSKSLTRAMLDKDRYWDIIYSVKTQESSGISETSDVKGG